MVLKALSVTTCFAIILCVTAQENFREELFIKPLESTHVYAHFQFVTELADASTFQHPQLASRALGEVISRFHVEELHLQLTAGQWRHNQWGYPVIDAPPGAEIYAWFSPSVADIDRNWKQLAATLSGMFCASLNFVDDFNTISPRMAFAPTGAFSSNLNISSYLRYATLPREVVCTENLTPWKKLLPCESHRGFASLLNSRMIHNTNYHSIGVHFRRACSNLDCSQTHLEIKQTVSLVYDYLILNSFDWSLRRLFGQGLPGACPLSSSSKIFVDITSNDTRPFKLTPPPNKVVISIRGGSETKLAIYDIKSDNQMINIAAKYETKNSVIVPVLPPLSLNRYVVGYGKEFGGIVTEISNNYWRPIDIVLLENAPWWLPIQLNTLRVNGESESKMIKSLYFSPGRSRQRPYHLELLLRLPSRSKTTISIEFEYVFLKWQEYPPDANHGFYIGSALVAANLPTARNYTSIPITGVSFESIVNGSQSWYPIVLRTNGAIISLPTPDFSMPYNVICLACTVVALAFGPLHNICTKRLVLKPLSSFLSIKQKVMNVLSILVPVLKKD